MSRQLEIIVDGKGQTRIETKGFEGAACLEATRQLEQALGLRQSERRTAEYYSSVNADQEQRMENG